MNLPLDIFQFLGVSPGSSSNNILMILEKRLNNCPYPDFSSQTLLNRRALLNEYSKILLDKDLRTAIEKHLTANIQTRLEQIMITSEKNKIASLLLLLEAGMHGECLSLATELLLQSKKQLQDNSVELSDLILLIGYSSIEMSDHVKSARHYDYSAQILEKALFIISDTGRNSKIENNISERLNCIMPFRILDLLSRNTDEDEARLSGINLLVKLVEQRGGLDNNSNLYIENREFQAFFRQIRYYLTVQEQIDIFQNWCVHNCKTAKFLLGIALVASGFSQRKPQRLIEALTVFQTLESKDLSPIIASLYLLLGQVKEAESLYFFSELNDNNIISDPLKNDTHESKLGNLCDYCREWLTKDVLEGYRDIEVNADLEAYFSDRDVTSFIEQQDKCGYPNKIGANITNPILDMRGLNIANQQNNPTSESWANNAESIDIKTGLLNTRLRNLNSLVSRKYIFILILLALAGLANIFFMLGHKKYAYKKTLEVKVGPSAKNSNFPSAVRQSLISKSNEGVARSNKTQEIIDLLSKWLKIKSDVLSGKPIPLTANLVASTGAIKALESEKIENQKIGEYLQISVKVLDLKILNETNTTMNVLATLSYSDKTFGKDGNILEHTPKHKFNKIYSLVKEGQTWKLR